MASKGDTGGFAMRCTYCFEAAAVSASHLLRVRVRVRVRARARARARARVSRRPARGT